jgi:hypothetical protein
MAEDSVIILKAYLGGTSPDSIVFADWFGTKSTENSYIKEYLVFNELSGKYEKKSLMSYNTRSRVKVSFKYANLNKEDFNINIRDLSIRPNPASDILNYSRMLNDEVC